MATGKLDHGEASRTTSGRLTVFSGVRDLPTRVKCAILPWHTLHAAFNSIGRLDRSRRRSDARADAGGVR
jgi:nitrogen fixation NifU-like protein